MKIFVPEHWNAGINKMVQWLSGLYWGLSRKEHRQVAAQHYTCVQSLNRESKTLLVWDSDTGWIYIMWPSQCVWESKWNIWVLKLCETLIFLNTLRCRFPCRWVKLIFDFQYSRTFGIPSEHLTSAPNHVNIFGNTPPTQQVSTSGHGERHA